jgi:hypothetical protein
MKHFMYLLIMAAVVCCTATAYATDFADGTFGILNEKQKKALNELDISSELKKADQAADANDFDKAKEICQKLLKQSGLSSEDKRQIEAKIDNIDRKRSDYLAQKAREEEDKKRQDEIARKGLSPEVIKKIESLSPEVIDNALRKSGVGGSQSAASDTTPPRRDEQADRRRIEMANDDALSIRVYFEFFPANLDVEKAHIKIRRIRDPFNKIPPFDTEKDMEIGSKFTDSSFARFSFIYYGLYQADINAYIDLRDFKKSASFSVQLVVDKKENDYEIVIDGKDVRVRRER